MADGVDDETWLHHLRAGDYSRWFREGIKDDALADEAAVRRARGRGIAGRQPRPHPRRDRAALHAACLSEFGVGS